MRKKRILSAALVLTMILASIPTMHATYYFGDVYNSEADFDVYCYDSHGGASTFVYTEEATATVCGYVEGTFYVVNKDTGAVSELYSDLAEERSVQTAQADLTLDGVNLALYRGYCVESTHDAYVHNSLVSIPGGPYEFVAYNR